MSLILPNNLELKPLTTQLLPAAVELDRLCFGKLWNLDGYQRELESPNSDLLAIQQIATGATDPKLLGIACQWAILEEAHIALLAVRPDCQHQGLGQFLLYSLLLAARDRGLKWATLEVGVSNQAALNLYQKFGFVILGQRRRYYQQTGEDASIMWLEGLQKPEFEQTLAAWEQKLSDRLSQNFNFSKDFPPPSTESPPKSCC